MNDDFNSPILISELFEGVKWINSISEGKASIDSDQLDLFKSTFNGFLFEVLGLQHTSASGKGDDTLSAVMDILINIRKGARTERNFALSDAIRDQLAAKGIQLKDGAEGTTWLAN
jgi:cysteinyl-tRNA synthetase